MKQKLWQLKQKQSLPLDMKIRLTKQRIKNWYEHWNGNVYVSFSGGKDSTVLLHLVRSIYPEVPAVFVDTGLEYPEIKEFVKTFDNVITIRPKKSFKEVLEKYGYPVISKKVARQIHDLQNPTKNNEQSRRLYLSGIKEDGEQTTHFKLSKKWRYLKDAPFKISGKCCDIMKKEPIKRYEKKNKRVSFIGTMADDSLQRETTYLQTGCNNLTNNSSIPIAFWLEKDVWEYINKFEIPYSKIYDTGVKRTGCMFCMFGVHLEGDPNRFQLMKESHPQLYKYCIEKLKIGEVLDYINIDYKTKQTKL